MMWDAVLMGVVLGGIGVLAYFLEGWVVRLMDRIARKFGRGV